MVDGGVGGSALLLTAEAARRLGVAVHDAADQAAEWRFEPAHALGDAVRRHPVGSRLDAQLDEMPPLRGGGGDVVRRQHPAPDLTGGK